MCINREKICKLLGDQPSTWSRHAPLLPPDWCAEQFTAFITAVRSAATGDVTNARDRLRMVRSDDLREWTEVHGMQAGYCRARRLHHPKPQPVPKKDRDTPGVSKELERQVFQRDGYRCRYCECRVIPNDVLTAFSKLVGVDTFCTTGTATQQHGAALTFRACADHLLPLRLGGRTDQDNLVTACWPCNFGKAWYSLDQIGLDDPRVKPMQKDAWDGLVSLFPELQRRVGRNVDAKLVKPKRVKKDSEPEDQKADPGELPDNWHQDFKDMAESFRARMRKPDDGFQYFEALCDPQKLSYEEKKSFYQLMRFCHKLGPKLPSGWRFVFHKGTDSRVNVKLFPNWIHTELQRRSGSCLFQITPNGSLPGFIYFGVADLRNLQERTPFWHLNMIKDEMKNGLPPNTRICQSGVLESLISLSLEVVDKLVKAGLIQTKDDALTPSQPRRSAARKS